MKVNLKKTYQRFQTLVSAKIQYIQTLLISGKSILGNVKSKQILQVEN